MPNRVCCSLPAWSCGLQIGSCCNVVVVAIAVNAILAAIDPPIGTRLDGLLWETGREALRNSFSFRFIFIFDFYFVSISISISISCAASQSSNRKSQNLNLKS